MVLEKLVKEMVDASGRFRSVLYKSVTMLVGAALFLIVVPLLLLLTSYGIEKFILSHHFRILQLILGLLSVAYGFFILVWSVLSQLRNGQGTPVPVAPTQKLIADGPYLKRRNPMLLGAIIYCFGVGTILDSITTGLIMFFLSLIFGTCYVKFIEEKELQIRFGKEYEEYREKTPFLIPRFL